MNVEVTALTTGTSNTGIRPSMHVLYILAQRAPAPPPAINEMRYELLEYVLLLSSDVRTACPSYANETFTIYRPSPCAFSASRPGPRTRDRHCIVHLGLSSVVCCTNVTSTERQPFWLADCRCRIRRFYAYDDTMHAAGLLCR